MAEVAPPAPASEPASAPATEISEGGATLESASSDVGPSAVPVAAAADSSAPAQASPNSVSAPAAAAAEAPAAAPASIPPVNNGDEVSSTAPVAAPVTASPAATAAVADEILARDEPASDGGRSEEEGEVSDDGSASSTADASGKRRARGPAEASSPRDGAKRTRRGRRNGSRGRSDDDRDDSGAPPARRSAAVSAAPHTFKTSDERNRCRLFLGNLPAEKVTKQQMLDVYEKYGRVLDLTFHRKYGFVQYDSPDAVTAALETKGMVFGGLTIDPQRVATGGHGESSRGRRDRSPGRGGRRGDGDDFGRRGRDADAGGRRGGGDDFGRRGRGPAVQEPRDGDVVKVLLLGRPQREMAESMVDECMRAGIPCKLEMPDGRNLGSAIRDWESNHSRYGIIVGVDNVRSGAVTMKLLTEHDRTGKCVTVEEPIHRTIAHIVRAEQALGFSPGPPIAQQRQSALPHHSHDPYSAAPRGDMGYGGGGYGAPPQHDPYGRYGGAAPPPHHAPRDAYYGGGGYEAPRPYDAYGGYPAPQHDPYAQQPLPAQHAYGQPPAYAYAPPPQQQPADPYHAPPPQQQASYYAQQAPAPQPGYYAQAPPPQQQPQQQAYYAQPQGYEQPQQQHYQQPPPQQQQQPPQPEPQQSNPYSPYQGQTPMYNGSYGGPTGGYGSGGQPAAAPKLSATQVNDLKSLLSKVKPPN